MAANQFETIADYLEIPSDERARLLYPKRAVIGLLPDPSRRRQHRGVPRLPGAAPPDLGADQGRHAVRGLGRSGRGGGASDLDELEVRAGRVALWRRQGRRDGRSGFAQPARAGGAVAALHAGDDPVRRPAHRRDGAGHGDQRAGDGVVHGHLFHVPGPDGDRDRDRQAGRVRRHGRAARGDGPRRGAPGDAGRGGAGDQSAWAPRRSCRASAMSAPCRRSSWRCVGVQGDRGQRPHGLLVRRARAWTCRRWSPMRRRIAGSPGSPTSWRPTRRRC